MERVSKIQKSYAKFVRIGLPPPGTFLPFAHISQLDEFHDLLGRQFLYVRPGEFDISDVDLTAGHAGYYLWTILQHECALRVHTYSRLGRVIHRDT